MKRNHQKYLKRKKLEYIKVTPLFFAIIRKFKVNTRGLQGLPCKSQAFPLYLPWIFENMDQTSSELCLALTFFVLNIF